MRRARATHDDSRYHKIYIYIYEYIYIYIRTYTYIIHMYIYIYTKLRRNEGHNRVSQGMWKIEGEPLANSSNAHRFRETRRVIYSRRVDLCWCTAEVTARRCCARSCGNGISESHMSVDVSFSINTFVCKCLFLFLLSNVCKCLFLRVECL